jgi:hypothetical protein
MFDKLVSESKFFKKIILKKWFIDFGTDITDRLSVSTDFNHYRPVYRF